MVFKIINVHVYSVALKRTYSSIFIDDSIYEEYPWI